MANEKKTYTGGCHCGKVRFEVTTNLTPVIECNCSICSKTAALLTFVPLEDFKLLSGDDGQLDYQWGKKRIHHLFCSECGIRSFARGLSRDGKETRAINVRCLEGVDRASLQITPFDGKSL